MMQNKYAGLFLIFLLVVLSRIPFIVYGYGSEEDAWALPLVAERIADTGVYEVSRLPGHPFQELIYVFMHDCGPVAYNLVTVLISSAGIFFFMLVLRRLHLENWLVAGAALAFTPIIYINSTNDMDYTWAMAFILAALYFVLKKNYLLTALFLAIATGCRITSSAMLIPFLIIMHAGEKEYFIRNALKLSLYTILFSIIIFLPVIYTYGISFFTYYEHFPIPGFYKNAYKGTVAVWGTTGFIALIVALFYILRKRKIHQPAITGDGNITPHVLIACIAAIFLVLISFVRLPLKAAFMIPAIPFVLLVLSIFLNRKMMIWTTAMIAAGCFFFGINLADSKRGSEVSDFALQFEISNQNIAFDPFQGILNGDISKRKQRTAYATTVINAALEIKQPAVIIAGWWLADILVLQKGKENLMITWVYYIDENDLKEFSKQKKQILHLADQDQLNDQRFKGVFTSLYSQSFDSLYIGN